MVAPAQRSDMFGPPVLGFDEEQLEAIDETESPSALFGLPARLRAEYRGCLGCVARCHSLVAALVGHSYVARAKS
jgi:hypothetical protein